MGSRWRFAPWQRRCIGFEERRVGARGYPSRSHECRRCAAVCGVRTLARESLKKAVWHNRRGEGRKSGILLFETIGSVDPVDEAIALVVLPVEAIILLLEHDEIGRNVLDMDDIPARLPLLIQAPLLVLEIENDGCFESCPTRLRPGQSVGVTGTDQIEHKRR
jgi:ferredoxin